MRKYLSSHKQSNTQSLLERARAIPRRELSKDRYSEEEIELTLAWLVGEITITQAAKAMGKNPGNIFNRMAAMVRAAYRQGYLTINHKAK